MAGTKFSTDNSLSFVIPIFNEEESLAILSSEIRAVAKDYKDWEIIFVDDGSSDNSAEIIEKLCAEDAHIRFIKFHRNYGKAAGLAEGFALAKGDVVFTLDGDLQDDPSEVPNFISKLNEGWDMVSGWKEVRHDPMEKRLPSKLFNATVRFFTGVKIHDFNCGYKAYRRKVIKTVEVYGHMHRYIPALAKQSGFSCSEIVVNHRPREYGKSKYGGARYLHGMLDLVTVAFLGRFLNRPMHLFGLLGIFFLLLGFGIDLYLSIRWLQGHFISGRPLFFLGNLSLIVGLQFFSLGLIGEMLTKKMHSNENRVQKILQSD